VTHAAEFKFSIAKSPIRALIRVLIADLNKMGVVSIQDEVAHLVPVEADFSLGLISSHHIEVFLWIVKIIDLLRRWPRYYKVAALVKLLHHVHPYLPSVLDAPVCDPPQLVGFGPLQLRTAVVREELLGYFLQADSLTLV
jgi:hypothetical protein